ncbi:hypothetical protein [Paenibacillus sp. DMB20]|uniref:hypothetical protein n=1 Tax=Paenibacillus sp. DMB20 TaxID=1642570 RepID=UPI0006277175|nr:hypothetical protein [Paenibacillus sp. DMB20]KKO51108.1 hypothetical protein XI25_29415 [Paenibacillus sp. DMB20]
MFYLKTEIDGEMYKVEIYDDEIFTTCLLCGNEIQVDAHTIIDVLRNGGDFASTAISCGCNPEKPKLIRIK